MFLKELADCTTSIFKILDWKQNLYSATPIETNISRPKSHQKSFTTAADQNWDVLVSYLFGIVEHAAVGIAEHPDLPECCPENYGWLPSHDTRGNTFVAVPDSWESTKPSYGGSC